MSPRTDTGGERIRVCCCCCCCVDGGAGAGSDCGGGSGDGVNRMGLFLKKLAVAFITAADS